MHLGPRASHGVVPNLITSNAAINACEAGLQWDPALSLLQVMAGSKAAALTNVTRAFHGGLMVTKW